MVLFFSGKNRTSSSPALSSLQVESLAVSSTDQDDTIIPSTVSLPPTPTSNKHRIEMMGPGGGAGGREDTQPQDLMATPISSKARQKKFHRHFKQVAQDEPVLNYYSCALVADILLQGHLYITKNYFAFYSNVFGYVTKLLIPTASVVKVTKEKTAYIIPNAVGITTEDDKHVFGSLLSRDSTYKLMVQVWTAATRQSPSHLAALDQAKSSPSPCLTEGEFGGEKESEDGVDGVSSDVHIEGMVPSGLMPVVCDDESSVSGSESNLRLQNLRHRPNSASKANQTLSLDVKSYQDVFSQTQVDSGRGLRGDYLSCISSIPRPTLLLILSTLLLVLLFTSATVLLFRISKLQQQNNIYSSDHFTTRSISEVQEFLDSNLEQISKVRQSLESLSLLIEGGDKQRWNSFANSNQQHDANNS